MKSSIFFSFAIMSLVCPVFAQEQTTRIITLNSNASKEEESSAKKSKSTSEKSKAQSSIGKSNSSEVTKETVAQKSVRFSLDDVSAKEIAAKPKDSPPPRTVPATKTAEPAASKLNKPKAIQLRKKDTELLFPEASLPKPTKLFDDKVQQTGFLSQIETEPGQPVYGYRRSVGSGLVFELEAMAVSYQRTDGLHVGLDAGEGVTPAWDIAPRMTIGYAAPGGTGIRGRWWDYGHNQHTQNNIAAEFISVDTYVVDLELFHRFSVPQGWELEVSGGVRYNEFEEELVDLDESVFDIRRNAFKGYGGVFGIEARRAVGFGTVYANYRAAILTGDKSRINGGLQFVGGAVPQLHNDANLGMSEIEFGWQVTRQTFGNLRSFLKVGAGWQKWHDYSSGFGNPIAFGGATASEEIYEAHDDVGFKMFTISFGLTQ